MSAVETPEQAAATSRISSNETVFRFFFFADVLVAVLLVATSKDTKTVPLPFPPFPIVTKAAKFKHSPALIYLVVALSVSGFYGVVSTVASFYGRTKPGFHNNVRPHLIILDVLFLGIMASATGAAGAVAYIGLKGNSHVGWLKVCNVYDMFCRHVGAAVILSFTATLLLIAILLISIPNLFKKLHK